MGDGVCVVFIGNGVCCVFVGDGVCVCLWVMVFVCVYG